MDKKITDLEYAITNMNRVIDEARAENAGGDRLRNLQERLADFEEQHRVYSAAGKQMHALADFTAETGEEAWYIRPDGYQILFRQTGSERRLSLILLLYVLFAFAGSSAYDNRCESAPLLRSTRRGRAGRRLRKGLWIAGLTCFAAIALHGLHVFCIHRDIGFFMPEAPAYSLEKLRWLPLNCSLRTVIVLLMAARCAAAVLLAGGTVLISRLSRTPEKALLTALAVFLLPSALAESGIAQLQVLDFIGRLTAVRSA